MYITSAKIRSYKNFLETQTFHLSPGFNVIIGQNDAGKTATIEALSLQFGNYPHRSISTVPNRLVSPPGPSAIEMQVSLAKEELEAILVDQVRRFTIPRSTGQAAEHAILDFERSISDPTVINFVFRSDGPAQAWFEGHPLPVGSNVTVSAYRAEHGVQYQIPDNAGGTQPGLVHRQVVYSLVKRIYLFRAERMNVGVSQFGLNKVLDPNASNLPQVLSVLQATNQFRFERFNKHVRTIFPHVTQVAIVPRDGNNVEIMLWTLPIETERDDLAIPLTQSGTGISQVLAILYVVMTAEFPQILLIDEPQSFLHPGAVRKLIEILKVHYPQHQYVLTTHSPHVISASDPGTLLLVKRGADQSTVEAVSAAATNQMNSVLSDVGARLSDVFGVDNIIWVEGATEEQCFPIILQYVTKRPLLGTAILAVEHTGDFEAKKAQFAERSFAIYTRLTEGTGLVPPALAFIFDREGRTPDQRRDLERRGQRKVHFLARRLYENYLLDATAIAACVNEIDGFRDTPVTPEEVDQWIRERCWGKGYFDRVVPEADRDDEVWFRDVHGARLLSDLFAKLSEERVTYQKTAHSVALTRWLVEHKPEALREVADMLSSILDEQVAPAD